MFFDRVSISNNVQLESSEKNEALPEENPLPKDPNAPIVNH